jgi:hypothetical protein
LELLLLLVVVLKVVLLLLVALDVVVPLGVIELFGGEVKLLPLGVVGDEVGGVAALEAAPRWSPPLWNLCKAQNFLASKAISSSRRLSNCSTEATAKEDNANSKADEIVVFMGLASWPPTRALVIKVLLVREAPWLGWAFLYNSWDLSLLNNFSVSRVAKLADSSRAVIFIPQTESSRAYNRCLACLLSEYPRGP